MLCKFIIHRFTHLEVHQKVKLIYYTIRNGSPTTNIVTYRILGGLPKNIIEPYALVSIWIIKYVMIVDDKYGYFLHNILKDNINIRQHNKNICQK